MIGGFVNLGQYFAGGKVWNTGLDPRQAIRRAGAPLRQKTVPGVVRATCAPVSSLLSLGGVVSAIPPVFLE